MNRTNKINISIISTILLALITTTTITTIAYAEQIDYQRYPFIKQWEKTFGEPTEYEYGLKVLETTDSYNNIRYAVVGGKSLFGTWLIITDKDGNKLYDKVYSGPGNGLNMISTTDKGYLIIGDTHTNPSKGHILKVDQNGNKLWNKTINSGRLYYARQTSTEYIFIGLDLGPQINISFVKTYLNGTMKMKKVISTYICDRLNADYFNLEYTISCRDATYPQYSTIFKLDNNGSVKSKRTVNTSDIYLISGIGQNYGLDNVPLLSSSPTKDGGFILSVNDYSRDHYADIRLIKLKHI